MSSGHASFDDTLFPNGVPTTESDIERTLELYRLMVQSSESLVSRRQSVNTFFLTINGAILTAAGLAIGARMDSHLLAAGLGLLSITGVVLALAWRSLIRSFGQLNTGKFAVINRIEATLPVSIYRAEWAALEEGRNPRKYRSFTSREVWVPWTFAAIYGLAAAASILFTTGLLSI